MCSSSIGSWTRGAISYKRLCLFAIITCLSQLNSITCWRSFGEASFRVSIYTHCSIYYEKLFDCDFKYVFKLCSTLGYLSCDLPFDEGDTIVNQVSPSPAISPYQSRAPSWSWQSRNAAGNAEDLSSPYTYQLTPISTPTDVSM